MNKKLQLIVIFSGIFIFSSCWEGFENYSTDANDVLEFSTDTVDFNTILSMETTPFRTLIVYNRHSKPLLINSIDLEQRDNFKINVDGKSDYSFQKIEIRGNDSIFVFINAYPNRPLSNTITNTIVFVTNNIKQKVVLEAFSQNVEKWQGKVICSDTVIEKNSRIIIYDSLEIKEGITIEIKEGSIFYMHGNNSEIIVKGTLKAKGKPNNPIIIRGDRFDKLVGNISYDLVPGQWKGIRFEKESYGNELTYIQIRNGKDGIKFEESNSPQRKAIMEHAVMTNFKGRLLDATNCYIEAKNCEFTNSQKEILRLNGGQYNFAYCTIANYYWSNGEGWGNSNNETVKIENSTKVTFDSTIIWGNKPSSEIKITSDNNISCKFQNCIIPNKDLPDTIAINCLNKDPKFKLTGKGDIPAYDFHLETNSPAINDSGYIGCYEYIPIDNENK